MRPEKLDAPIEPVLGERRVARQRMQALAVVAVAIAVLGVGIGFAGNGATVPSTPPAPRDAPSVSPTGTAAPIQSVAVASLAPPTENPGLGCAPVRLGSPPGVVLMPGSGDISPAIGVSAASTAGPASSPGPSGEPNWPIPPPVLAAHLDPNVALFLVADEGACVRYVLADYAPADPSAETAAGISFPLALQTLDLIPPQSDVDIGSLPTGDWVVRVVAYFSSGQLGQEDANVSERFFRVVSGDPTRPRPTPEVTPAVPCTAQPAGASPPTLTLTGSGSGPIAGLAPPTGTQDPVEVELGNPLDIRVDGDACARAWNIVGHDLANDQTVSFGSEVNGAADPFRFAQNRWRLDGLPIGRLQVTADMTFSPGVYITAQWSLVVRAPKFPPVRIVAGDGTGVLASLARGASWSFPDGSGGFEAYPGSTPAPALRVPTLVVIAGTTLRISAGDWTVAGWNGACGVLDVAANPVGLVVVDGCDLGASETPGGGVFVARPGKRVVQLNVQLSREGVTASGTVYATIDGAPSAAP